MQTLDDLIDHAYAQLESAGGDPLQLPDPARTVVLVSTAQALIENGGFEYFFENDFPGTPDYAVFVAAYRRIGASEAASHLEAAVTLFGFDAPHLHREQRLAFLEELDADDEFIRRGDAVCIDKRIWEALHRYAEAS